MPAKHRIMHFNAGGTRAVVIAVVVKCAEPLLHTQATQTAQTFSIHHSFKQHKIDVEFKCSIYYFTNDCTVIPNTIIMNNMLLPVSTFKMSSSRSSLCLAKIKHRFSGLSKIKLLKYKMINFNKMLIVQPLHKSFITLYNQHFIEVYHFIF